MVRRGGRGGGLKPCAGGSRRGSSPRRRESPAEGARQVNRNDAVDIVAARTGTDRTAAAKAVTALVEAMAEALARGEDVHLARFGRFTVRIASERAGVNPRTGEPMTVPARRRVAFAPYREFREAALGGPGRISPGARRPRP